MTLPNAYTENVKNRYCRAGEGLLVPLIFFSDVEMEAAKGAE